MFSLAAPEVSGVEIAGSFNEWQPEALLKGADGIWRITIQLAHGTYEYRFRVDGVWREDPSNLRRLANDVGGYNSVCNVL
jgi:1,4-alpha-glucan branching enzyme